MPFLLTWFSEAALTQIDKRASALIRLHAGAAAIRDDFFRPKLLLDKCRLRRRGSEQDSVVENCPEFWLWVANIALLPEIGILHLQAEAFQWAFCGAVLGPKIQL